MVTISTIKVMFAIVVSEYANQSCLLRCIYRKIRLENNNCCCLRIMTKRIKQHIILRSIKKIVFFGNFCFSEATFLIILKCSICMWRQTLFVQLCSALPGFSTKDSAEHEHTAKRWSWNKTQPKTVRCSPALDLKDAQWAVKSVRLTLKNPA